LQLILFLYPPEEKRQALTLRELPVVMGILSALLAMTVPGDFRSAASEKRHSTK